MGGIRSPRQSRPKRQGDYGRGERPRPRRQKPFLHETLPMDDEPPQKQDGGAAPAFGAAPFVLSSSCYCRMPPQYTRFALFCHLFCREGKAAGTSRAFPSVPFPRTSRLSWERGVAPFTPSAQPRFGASPGRRELIEGPQHRTAPFGASPWASPRAIGQLLPALHTPF